MLINKGVFNSPYYIFLKEGFQKSDEEILSLLGLENYSRVIKNNGKRKNDASWKNPVFITDEGSWMHIMDDWGYQLWHRKNIKDKVIQLAEEFDVFSFSVGDIDYSFDFFYYKNGKLIRKYVVEDSMSEKGLIVAEDIGKPFDIEKEALAFKEPFQIVTMIAKSLGITFNHKEERIRAYGECVAREHKIRNLWNRFWLKLDILFE